MNHETLLIELRAKFLAAEVRATAAEAALRKEQQRALELEKQLSLCGALALANVQHSLDRIKQENPHPSVAVGNVMRAMQREINLIKFRDEVASLVGYREHYLTDKLPGIVTAVRRVVADAAELRDVTRSPKSAHAAIREKVAALCPRSDLSPVGDTLREAILFLLDSAK